MRLDAPLIIFKNVVRIRLAPEFWYYYPAKLLGVDMIEFERKVPFHQALKKTFETYGCEGWGAAFYGIPSDKIKTVTNEKWIDADTLEVRSVTSTPAGNLEAASVFSREEPSWATERPVKNVEWISMVFASTRIDDQGTRRARGKAGGRRT